MIAFAILLAVTLLILLMTCFWCLSNSSVFKICWGSCTTCAGCLWMTVKMIIITILLLYMWFRVFGSYSKYF
jgi:hypothetical protein